MAAERLINQNLILFLPSSVKKNKKLYMFGESCRHSEFTHVFYILQVAESVNSTSHSLLGCVGSLQVTYANTSHWVGMKFVDGIPQVTSMIIRNKSLNPGSYFCVWIFYKPEIFMSPNTSGLLAKENQLVSRNLVTNLARKFCVTRHNKGTGLWISVIPRIVTFMSAMAKFLKIFAPILKYSTLGEHVQSYVEDTLILLDPCQKQQKMTVQLKSYILCIMINMILGSVVLTGLLTILSWDAFPDMFLTVAETVVTSLRDLLHWLRGDPAGFKLNYAFNNMLATFFIFHIDIWWIFLVFLKPVFQVIFVMFIIVGQLGLTFQVSILADLLALVSFHVYCIYAYAARLYNIQIAGLISLWRLFIGRKMNPLRGKVDSCSYTPDQLFVGTLGFTILLFLLPTTLMYYTVFTTIRLLVVGFGGCLMHIRHTLHSMPVYSVILWILGSSEVCTSARLTPGPTANILHLTLLPDTLFNTIARFEPDCLTHTHLPSPHPMQFSQVVTNLLKGKLVYPV